MGRRVAIIGSAQTRHEGRKIHLRDSEMVFLLVKELLEKTGVALKEIDFVVESGSDYLDGRVITGAFVQEATGSFMKEESRVTDDGAYAAEYAYARILAGTADIALVVAYSKSSVTGGYWFGHYIFDPIFQRPVGLDLLTASALQAQLYMDRYGITEEQAARVVVKNRKNGLKNPYAQVKQGLSVEDVLSSGMLATPIKKLDAPPVTDGGCALILASEEKASHYTQHPVWIKGVSFCVDSYYLGRRDLLGLRSCRIATQRAYEMAGIKEPLMEIDVAEVTADYSFQELMLYEALGFCGEGEGGRLIDQGITEMEGELPVNPSGGPLCANPFIASGLIRIAEAALQVSGDAGERQVEEVKTALAHATCGACFQSNCVFILGVDK